MPVQGSAEEQKYWQWRVEKEEREALDLGLRNNPNLNPNRNYHIGTLGVPFRIVNRPTTSEFAVARGSVGTGSTVEGSLAAASVTSRRSAPVRRGGGHAGSATGRAPDIDLRSLMSQRTAQTGPRSKVSVKGSKAGAAQSGVSGTSSAVLRRLSLLEDALQQETERRVAMERDLAKMGATHRGPVPSSQRPRALGFGQFGVEEGEPDTGKAMGTCNPTLFPKLYNPLLVVGGGEGPRRKPPVQWATHRPGTAPVLTQR